MIPHRNAIVLDASITDWLASEAQTFPSKHPDRLQSQALLLAGISFEEFLELPAREWTRWWETVDRVWTAQLIRSAEKVAVAMSRKFAHIPCDDIQQELLVRWIAKLRNTFDMSRPLEPFLYGAARKIALEFTNATKPSTSHVSLETLEISGREVDSETLDWQLAKSILDATLSGTSEGDLKRYVLVRYFEHDETAEVIARDLGLSASSVRAIVSRVRASARECLAAQVK